MNGFEAALLGWGVFCTALLIVAIGCIDDLRDQLKRERVKRAVQHNVFLTSLATGMEPGEVASAMARALRITPKGNTL